MKEHWWVILVGGGYGAFLFEGTQKEAEAMRAHKANWEHAVVIKRKSTDEEIKTDKPSSCWNHPGYETIKKGMRYVCWCNDCRPKEK